MLKTIKKTAVFTLLFLAISLTALSFKWRYFLHTPLNIPNEGRIIDIESGATKKITNMLYKEGILINPKLFTLLAKFKGLDTKLKTGEYLLIKGSTPVDLLNQLVKGEVIQHQFKIIEGLKYKEIKTLILTNKYLQQDLINLSEQEILDLLSLKTPSIEGYLFPDTYYFIKGTKASELLKRAHLKMKKVLAENWEGRASNLPYKNEYEALILASIIEKETALKEEKPLIAGVLINRLRENMLLQVDPTVIYGLDNFNGKISYQDLKTNTPYNTYLRKGLPLTPISMPGLDSIIAAIHPANTKYKYFVSDGNKKHIFASNLVEHNKNVHKLLEQRKL